MQIYSCFLSGDLPQILSNCLITKLKWRLENEKFFLFFRVSLIDLRVKRTTDWSLETLLMNLIVKYISRLVQETCDILNSVLTIE
jgi:hypothetical protein